MEKIKNIEAWSDSVIAFWKSANIELNDPGASDALIEKTESVTEFEFPASFKSLYKKVNGFKGNDWNENMIAVWPMERIISEFPFRERQYFVPFADWLICSCAYGFVKEKSGIYRCFDLTKTTPEKIADSFDDVIDLINANSDLLY